MLLNKPGRKRQKGRKSIEVSLQAQSYCVEFPNIILYKCYVLLFFCWCVGKKKNNTTDRKIHKSVSRIHKLNYM